MGYVVGYDGVKLPATQVPSSDVNTLDDYEEGAWTPTVTFGGGSTGITYSAQVGSYTKIGNRVFCSAYVVLTSKGSSTGSAVVTALPFTIATGNHYAAVALRIVKITFANFPQAFGVTNTTTVRLEEVTTGGVLTDLTDADFANDSEFMLSLSYRV